MSWDWGLQQWQGELWKGTDGRFNPDEATRLRRPEGASPSSIEEAFQARVSVVCPTTDRRHEFHGQLWAVFDAQSWPDKELVVVETYTDKPSPFFVEKAKHDDRIIFVSYRVRPGQDWTIGLKRNICTFLASGIFVANFDDDDLYAPNYLEVMMTRMLEQKSEAITLSTYYVFDVRSGKFGWTDQRYASESTRYGYGFSYVFLRGAALHHPYPDKNMGEDYGFFSALRKRRHSTVFGGDRHVALHEDQVGICCHTLHPKATSNVYAKREVPIEEAEGLDFADLDILETYVSRFPQTHFGSCYIGKVERREQKVKIHLSLGDFEVSCLVGATVAEVQQLLHPQLQCGGSPTEVHLHCSRPPCLQSKAAKAEEEAALPTEGAAAEGIADQALEREREARAEAVRGAPALDPADRVTRRRVELWATLPAERHEEPTVELTVRDMRNPDVSVSVWVHATERLASVRQAVIRQHGSTSEAGRKAARELRLAQRCVVQSEEKESAFFRAHDLSHWLLDRRDFHAPGLQRMLDQAGFDRGAGLPVIRVHLLGVEEGFLLAEVPLPCTARELKAELGDRLPDEVQLYPGCPQDLSGKPAPEVLEEDVRLPSTVTVDRLNGSIVESVFYKRAQAIQAQQRCIAELERPDNQMLLGSLEADVGGNYLKYRVKMLESLPTKVYRPVLQVYGLPLDRRGVLILSSSIQAHWSESDSEMAQNWLNIETLMHNKAGVKAAEATVNRIKMQLAEHQA